MIDLATVARHGLAGAPDSRFGQIEAGSWARLLQEATNQRLTGLLTAMVLDGSLEPTGEQEEALVEAHRAALARDLLVERTVLWAVGCLDAAGVDHRVLKGTATAHLDYDDPGLRSFVDADLLVRPDHWDRAVGALENGGARRESREPRRGWDRRFAKGVTLTTPGRYEIDLHRTFVFGPLGFTVGLPDLWAGAEDFALGGRRLRALDREARWLHACFTAAAADVPARLVSLRDVLQLAADPRLDLARTETLARAWRATAIVRRATSLAAETLGVAPPDSVRRWGAGLVVDRTEESILRHYTDPGDRYVRLTIEAVRFVPGLRAKAAYATGLLWPEAGYVGYRYRSRLERWHSVLSRARQAMAPGAGGQRHARVKGS